MRTVKCKHTAKHNIAHGICLDGPTKGSSDKGVGILQSSIGELRAQCAFCLTHTQGSNTGPRHNLCSTHRLRSLCLGSIFPDSATSPAQEGWDLRVKTTKAKQHQTKKNAWHLDDTWIRNTDNNPNAKPDVRCVEKKHGKSA